MVFGHLSYWTAFVVLGFLSCLAAVIVFNQLLLCHLVWLLSFSLTSCCFVAVFRQLSLSWTVVLVSAVTAFGQLRFFWPAVIVFG